MKSEFYDEQTLICPYSQIEVYGQDGYGWYVDKSDAEDEVFKKFGKIPSQNPLFVYLDGCTKKKLHGSGFITV